MSSPHEIAVSYGLASLPGTSLPPSGIAPDLLATVKKGRELRFNTPHADGRFLRNAVTGADHRRMKLRRFYLGAGTMRNSHRNPTAGRAAVLPWP